MPQVPLNLCVCGWYFHDDWYASLLRLQMRGVKVHIVANQFNPLLEVCELPYSLRENTGLEWGAYNYYLNNIWEGGPIIFSHDDMAFQPVMTVDNKIQSGEEIFPRLGSLGIDQGYVFSSRQEDAINWGKHGRMVFMSSLLAGHLWKDGGIWYDEDNSRNYNSGINRFDERMKEVEVLDYDVRNKIYFPGIAHGYRGQFRGRVIDGNDIETDGLCQSG